MHKPVYDPDANAVILVPDDEATDRLSGEINVFVCGGLQNPDKMRGLLGKDAAFAPAVVTGYTGCVSETHDGKQMPFMIPAEPDSVLPGVVWLDLAPADLAAVEAFELAGDYRKRITVRARCGSRFVNAVTFVKR